MQLLEGLHGIVFDDSMTAPWCDMKAGKREMGYMLEKVSYDKGFIASITDDMAHGFHFAREIVQSITKKYFRSAFKQLNVFEGDAEAKKSLDLTLALEVGRNFASIMISYKVSSFNNTIKAQHQLKEIHAKHNYSPIKFINSEIIAGYNLYMDYFMEQLAGYIQELETMQTN